MTEPKQRCAWCLDGGRMQEYHDTEWGVPVHDDQKLFEFLTLEVLQCGLNWAMILKKRDTFRRCFDGFDYEKIARYDEKKIQEIMIVPNMIRSPGKIRAIIHNASEFIKIRKKFGSFDAYIWSFTNYQTVVYPVHAQGKVPAKNALSDAVSKDLKRRGFKYTGSVTVYSCLQACGIINDHAKSCFRYLQLTRTHAVQNGTDDMQTFAARGVSDI